jgi:homoserine O-acetyltransferase
MAARNWMMRRLMIETILQDPTYKNGDYTEQPRSMKLANVFYSTGTNGGTLAYQKLARRAKRRQTRRRASGRALPCRREQLHLRLGVLCRYNPTPLLERIKAPCSSSMLPTTNAIHLRLGLPRRH